MKLPVSATIKKVRARVTSIVLNDRCEGSKTVSIENSDSGHRKIPFVGGVDSHQIGPCPDRVESDSALKRSGSQWKDEDHEGQSEEACEESRSEEAGCQEEEEVVDLSLRDQQELPWCPRWSLRYL
jgi:hypothetical protein